MVPAATPAFLRLSDGKVLGVAKKAEDDSTFSVVTEPKSPTRSTPVATTPAPTTSTTAAAPKTTTKATTKPATKATTKAATKATKRAGATKPPVADPAPAH
jgi:hypothetical protein